MIKYFKEMIFKVGFFIFKHSERGFLNLFEITPVFYITNNW